MTVACRRRRDTDSLTAAMIDLNTYQVHLGAPDSRPNAKTIILKPKVPEVLKVIASPSDR